MADNPTVYEVSIPKDAYLVDIQATAESAYTHLYHFAQAGNDRDATVDELWQLRYGVKRLMVASQDEPNETVFYAVSSNGQYQQMYTVRLYYIETDTAVDNNPHSNAMSVNGVYVNGQRLLADASGRTYQIDLERSSQTSLTVVPNNGMATVTLRDANGALVSSKVGGGVFENLDINGQGQTLYTFTVTSANGEEISEPYQVYMNYVDMDSTEILGVTVYLNDGYDKDESDANRVREATQVTMAGGEKVWIARVPEDTTQVSAIIRGSNQYQTISTTGSTGKGQLTLPMSLDSVTTGVPFEVAPATVGGQVEKTTIYVVRANLGLKELEVNGSILTENLDGYTASVPEGTTGIRIHATSGDPLVKVRIGSNDFAFGEDTQDVVVRFGASDTYVIPITISSYPYDVASTVQTTLKICRFDSGYALNSLLIDRRDGLGMVEMTTNTWGQYVTKLESSAFDLHLTTANAGQTVSLWQNGHIIRGTVSENKDSFGNVVNYQYTIPVTGVTAPVTEYQLRVVQGNKGSIDYPVIVYKPQTNTGVASVAINPGRENKVDVTQSGKTYAAELDMAETSARLVIKSDDSRATISMQDPAGSNRVYQGVGMLDIQVPLNGTAKTVDFTVRATDGKSEDTYQLDLTQTYSTTVLGVVTVNGKALIASGKAYTMVGQLGTNADLTITAGDNVTIEVLDRKSTRLNSSHIH